MGRSEAAAALSEKGEIRRVDLDGGVELHEGGREQPRVEVVVPKNNSTSRGMQLRRWEGGGGSKRGEPPARKRELFFFSGMAGGGE